MTAVAADFDKDGWPDIFVACDSTPSLLLLNNHDGTFREEGVLRGVALSEDGMEQAGHGSRRRRLQPRRSRSICSRPILPTIPTGSITMTARAISKMSRSRPHRCRNPLHVLGAGIVDLDNDGWPDFSW